MANHALQQMEIVSLSKENSLSFMGKSAKMQLVRVLPRNMKRRIVFLPALIVGLGLIPAGRVTAQVFKTLHSFL